MDHIHAHLEGHADFLSEASDLIQVAAMYNLLSEFRVKNPAEIIAKHLDIHSIRTVHDRIRRARADNLIQSHGRGRSYG